MSLDFSDIVKKSKTIQVEAEGNKFEITYKTSMFNAKSREKLKDFEFFIEWEVWFILNAVTDWNLEFEGKKMEINAETLSMLPDTYLDLIYMEMREGTKLDPKPEKTI